MLACLAAGEEKRVPTPTPPRSPLLTPTECPPAFSLLPFCELSPFLSQSRCMTHDTQALRHTVPSQWSRVGIIQVLYSQAREMGSFNHRCLWTIGILHLTLNGCLEMLMWNCSSNELFLYWACFLCLQVFTHVIYTHSLDPQMSHY